jgi:hypothetical protein
MGFVWTIGSCSLGAEEIYFDQPAECHEEESLQPIVSAQVISAGAIFTVPTCQFDLTTIRQVCPSDLRSDFRNLLQR